MTEKVIEVKDLTFRYFESEQLALNNVSLSINKNEWVAIIGPNGSGKSTLAKVINGLLVPEAGEVYINSLLLNEESVWNIRRLVGMVFQNPDNQFVGATVEDDVAFGLENHGVERDEMIARIEEALEQVRMTEYKKSEPARLSGGQKQRVAIAGVLALRPEVIILDEATAMLDPVGRKEVIAAVKAIKEKYNLTVISITHDIDEASNADRIIVMNQGKLVRQDDPYNIFILGDELIKMGLDIPFAQKIHMELERRGIEVPKEYLSEEELFEWLTTSYLTK
ncbi:MAG TPA: energy-coupling factor ABC transporter ATP-binding protein [Globicatella sulfidifaciens]|uniref:Energy-coupling factor transport system ATP-binding protein n=2 Tax=Globicatella sulfidifaciens TaxID=136093 RepID=A0A1T4KD56_9LACT|nr:energy-coupling factor ABC transporter ATP-binding protein [Globicatella sulfidifaciens]NLJ18061.1 energy-coupling factor ABC transporter ATP-binding protein [Globicatella sulfidifaciens]SJZ40307.1 energy-coupling factor transport system ATP-binding protein [Globicatella sulfidifaciens DSM 15739]HJF16520.1 energy-coupling factor ABC transporter ATP-binding protein [Globicatella sulfidifaciens]